MATPPYGRWRTLEILLASALLSLSLVRKIGTSFHLENLAVPSSLLTFHLDHLPLSHRRSRFSGESAGS